MSIKCLLYRPFQEILTDAVRTWKEKRRNSVGVVNPVTFLHLEPLQIQEDCIMRRKRINKYLDLIILWKQRHLFKWADECLVEEVDDIKSLISGMNKDISEFRVNVALLQKEIEVMKTASGGKGEECMSQGRCLRN
ncbi:hypothetical protein HID58_007983, partial [Brassica napus]